jgi:hypothetical protein
MAWGTLDKDRLEQIVRQITGKKLEQSKMVLTSALIKGSGIIFLWAPNKKTFIKVNRGVRIYIASYETDDRDRILVYDGFNLLAIHPDDLDEVGFN